MKKTMMLVPYGWLDLMADYWKLLGKGVVCYVIRDKDGPALVIPKNQISGKSFSSFVKVVK